jgi:hypothetical protein
MKKLFYVTLCLTLCFSFAAVSHAQQQPSGVGITSQQSSAASSQVTNPSRGANLGYTPLEPIPGLTVGTGGYQLNFPQMLGNIYKIVIIIGALFSVLMLTISGIRYMLSDVVTSKEMAIKRIKACLYGLVLIAASYLILNTINPQLVTFTLQPGNVTINGNSAPVQTQPNGQTAQQQAVTASQDKISNTAAGQAAFTPAECADAKSNYDSFLAQWQALTPQDRLHPTSQVTNIKAGMLNSNIIIDSCTTNTP